MKTIITLLSCLLISMTTFSQKNNKYKFLTQKLDLDKKLKQHRLPGFSLTIFEDYKIVYSKQWGVKSSEATAVINSETAFNTASITKPIVALLCLKLEEKGLLNLNDPVATYLKRWQIPTNEFTKNTAVTFKHLLTHTAGTTHSGFADFYEGDTIPTITQSLKGKLLPRYDKEISVVFKPGTNWKYSGGGYVIIQMALEDHFKKPIATLTKEYIFDPLHLKNTTLLQPNEKGFLKNVAKVHDKDGNVIKTGLPITPQVAPSGMWSTANELATFAIEIQKALSGNKSSFISKDLAKKYTEVMVLKNAVGGWGLGWQHSFGFKNQQWLSTNGSNTGVGSQVLATMRGGNGFTLLANGEKPNRFPVIAHVNSIILETMDWGDETIFNKKVPIPNEIKKELIGEYNDFLYNLGFKTIITESNGNLYVASGFLQHFTGKENSELIHLGNNLYKIIDYPNHIQINIKNNKVGNEIIVFRKGNTDLKMTTQFLKK